MFDKNSGLVQIWVKLILDGTYTIYDVPDLFNLKEIVESILEEK